MGFDPYKARADFPILATEAHGKPLVYLDSAASAQKPRMVMDAMVDVMENSYANVHRGIHYLSNKATDLMEASRARIADFLGANDPNVDLYPWRDRGGQPCRLWLGDGPFGRGG